MATESDALPWDVCLEPGLSATGQRVFCSLVDPHEEHVALDAFGGVVAQWPVKAVHPEAPGWLVDAEAAEATA